MALPTIEKTWQYSVNQAYGSGTGVRAGLLGLKNSLLGFASNPWTVGYSCGFNGVTQVFGAPNDGIDYWTAATSLVWQTGASVKSWIVLKQANTLAAGGFQLLIECRSALTTNYFGATVVISPTAGFTGGNTTTRPTATDEIVLNSTGWASSDSGSTGIRIHVAQSTDGQCTRYFVCQDNRVTAIGIFDRIKSPRAAITEPFVAGVVTSNASGSANAPTVANLNGAAGLRSRFAGATSTLYVTGEAFGGSLIGQQITTADDYEAAYTVRPMGLASLTVGAHGAVGQLFDLAWGPTGSNNGDDYDDTANMLWATMRDVLHPAGGVVWLVV